MSNLSKRLEREPLADVTAAYIDRVRLEKGTVEKARAAMPSRGYEEIQEDGDLTADGREIVNMYGKRWALRSEVHTERLEQRMAEVKALKAMVVENTQEVREAIAATKCPQMHNGKPCGGALNVKPVCPGCPVGREGYRYRYQCDTCNFDIVTKTELSE
jgi:hypothetical protein